MNKITIHSQDFKGHSLNPNIKWFSNDWDLPRKPTLSYTTEVEGVRAAENAFRLLNIPPEELSAEEREIIKDFSGPSLSVGDVVEIETPHGENHRLLCTPEGWDQITQKIEKKSLRVFDSPCKVEASLYGNGRIALQLLTNDSEDDPNFTVPLARPTLNLPDAAIGKNRVFIKNYSENQGIADELERGGVAKKTGRNFTQGDYDAEIVEMEITDPEILNQIKTLQEKIKNPPKEYKNDVWKGLC